MKYGEIVKHWFENGIITKIHQVWTEIVGSNKKLTQNLKQKLVFSVCVFYYFMNFIEFNCKFIINHTNCGLMYLF